MDQDRQRFFLKLQLWLAQKRFLKTPLGYLGERYAEAYLKDQGYYTLFRNLTFSDGEIDLVVWQPQMKMLIIVEVKSRRLTEKAQSASASDWLPEGRVDEAKKRKLRQLAKQLVLREGIEDFKLRFDVIGVDVSGEKNTFFAAPAVFFRHYENAF